MASYIFKVQVDTDNYHQARQVMAERLGPDEDYGFDYTVDVVPPPTAYPAIVVWGLDEDDILGEQIALNAKEEEHIVNNVVPDDCYYTVHPVEHAFKES